MAHHRDIEISEDLVGVIDHMAEVQRYREDLNALGQRLDLLTILGLMNGAGTDLTDTQEGFRALTTKLIGCLGEQTLSKLVQDISAKAQVSVDIVIRNLFERTADVGFLATDDDLRVFLQRVERAEALGQSWSALVPAIVQRFREYVAKYSVYDDIIVLDRNGQVLVQMSGEPALAQCSESWVQDSMTTDAEFVESYIETCLRPDRGKSLLYTHRITEDGDRRSAPIGVLCLCFRFEDELSKVFSHLRNRGSWEVITLLDADHHVIASSDPVQVPIGAQMPPALDRVFKQIQFSGRSYLAHTARTRGYQGFEGLGWYGHVMIGTAQAFTSHASTDGGVGDATASLDPSAVRAISAHSQLFSADVKGIPLAARRIQRELDRSVWNGNLQGSNATDATAASSAKVLLREIGKCGARTESVFKHSIANLHNMVLSKRLQDVEFQASLAVNIMDRNLYERCNDCRWWALTGEFRTRPSDHDQGKAWVQRLTEKLAYIHDLYTVYSNLILFDDTGTIIAVSTASEAGLVGKRITAPWVDASLRLTSSQDYVVSDFEFTELYGSRPTYIYATPVRAPDRTENVGGIAIVFDSGPQFESMLKGSLSEPEATDSFALFVERSGLIVGSTHQDLAVGGPGADRAEHRVE